MVGAASHKPIADYRSAERHRAFLGAKLVYGGGAFTLDCVVRDITDDGARIKLPEGQAVPGMVYLLELRSGVAYEAEVAWKRHPEIGLKFLRSFDLATASGPELTLMKRLWIEHRQRAGI